MIRLQQWIIRVARKGILIACTTLAFGLIAPARADAHHSKPKQEAIKHINDNSVVDVANAALKESGKKLSSSRKSWTGKNWKFRQALAKASGLGEVWHGTKGQNTKLLNLWKQNGFPKFDNKNGTFIIPVVEKSAPASQQNELLDNKTTFNSDDISPESDIVEEAVTLLSDDQKIAIFIEEMNKSLLGQLLQNALKLERVQISAAASANIAPVSFKQIAPKVIPPTSSPIQTEIPLIKKSTEVAHSFPSKKRHGVRYVLIIILIVLITGIIFLGVTLMRHSKKAAKKTPLTKIPKPSESQTISAKPVIKKTFSQPAREEAEEKLTPDEINIVPPHHESLSVGWILKGEEAKKRKVIEMLRGKNIKSIHLQKACWNFSEFDAALSESKAVELLDRLMDKNDCLRISGEVQALLAVIKRDLGSGYELEGRTLKILFTEFSDIISSTPKEFQDLLWYLAQSELSVSLLEIRNEIAQTV